MKLSARIGIGLVLAALLPASWLGLGGCSISVSDLIATVDRRPLLTSLRDSLLIPASARFAARAADLEAAAKALAADPDSARLDSARARWKDAALAWASLQPVRVGPIADLTPRLYFWPTRPNLIQQGLAATDELDSARMAALTPAAAKGLPALEWLLFSSSSDSILAAFADSAKGPRRGAYLSAAAADVRGMAETILREWQGGTGARFVEPAAGSRYPTTQMAVEELIKGLVTSVEEMKNAKVGAPSGITAGGRPQPALVEAPYADFSLPILRANLDAVEAAFEGRGGMGLNGYLESLDSPLPAKIGKAMAGARSILDILLDTTLSAAVVDDAATVKLLSTHLQDLVVTVKNDVASAVGVSITFTDNDGD